MSKPLVHIPMNSRASLSEIYILKMNIKHKEDVFVPNDNKIIALAFENKHHWNKFL